MRKIFEAVKKTFYKEDEEDIDDVEEEYVELDTVSAPEEKKAKVLVKPFTINDFSDVKDILDSLRQGMTIGLINIKPLKTKDLVELKRVINKLKKTCDAIEGDIAGFGDDYLVVAPAFARIYRTKETARVQQQQ